MELLLTRFKSVHQLYGQHSGDVSKSELAEVTGKIPPQAIEAVWEGIKSNVFWKLQVNWQAPLIRASAAAPCLEDCYCVNLTSL